MKFRGALLTAALLICAAMPAVGQPTGEAQSEAMAADLQGIHQALDRLVELLESTQQRQQVELLMKRIEMRERRQAPLESRRRTAENEVNGLQDELKHLDAMWEQQEAHYERSLEEGEEVSPSDKRRMRDEFERMKAAITARADEARLRVQRAEDDLYDGRKELEILDEQLMELLESQ